MCRQCALSQAVNANVVSIEVKHHMLGLLCPPQELHSQDFRMEFQSDFLLRIKHSTHRQQAT